MRVIASVLAAAALSVASAQLSGDLPQEWSAVVTSSIAINQGGSLTPNGLCCSATAPECKIQTGFEGGQMYFSASQNATAQIVGPGESIVTLFNDGKQYQVENGACVSYCPLKGENAVMQPFSVASVVGPNATFEGNTADPAGTTGAQYTSVEKFIIWTMSTSNGWFDTSSNTPLQVQTIISPFGQQLGQEMTTYQHFTAGTPPASVFAVSGASTCKLGQCGHKRGGGSSSSSSPSSSSSSSPAAEEPEAEARELSADGTPQFDAESVFYQLAMNRRIPGLAHRGPLNKLPELK